MPLKHETQGREMKSMLIPAIKKSDHLNIESLKHLENNPNKENKILQKQKALVSEC